MVRLKEAQQDCQDRHDHQGGQSNVVQVRQSFLKGVCHHGNPRLDVPAASETTEEQCCHAVI